MRALSYVVPFASIAILTLVAALPWGLPSEDRFVLPMLPIIAIHYWSLRQTNSVPEWPVFLAGLALDILTHGPLGFWALIYLLAYVLGVLSAPYGHLGQIARIGLFAAALAAVAVAAWAVSSLYVLEAVDWRPYAAGAGYAGLASIVIVPILHALGAAQALRDNTRLERGV
jgi:rod shape-determining protein MreD